MRIRVDSRGVSFVKGIAISIALEAYVTMLLWVAVDGIKWLRVR